MINQRAIAEVIVETANESIKDESLVHRILTQTKVTSKAKKLEYSFDVKLPHENDKFEQDEVLITVLERAFHLLETSVLTELNQSKSITYVGSHIPVILDAEKSFFAQETKGHLLVPFNIWNDFITYPFLDAEKFDVTVQRERISTGRLGVLSGRWHISSDCYRVESLRTLPFNSWFLSVDDLGAVDGQLTLVDVIDDVAKLQMSYRFDVNQERMVRGLRQDWSVQ